MESTVNEIRIRISDFETNAIPLGVAIDLARACTSFGNIHLTVHKVGKSGSGNSFVSCAHADHLRLTQLNDPEVLKQVMSEHLEAIFVDAYNKY